MIALNVPNHSLSAPDHDNPVQGNQTGVTLQGDFYANPTPETMVFGLGSYSTAFQTYYTEFKGGLQLFGIKELYFGPQLSSSWRLVGASGGGALMLDALNRAEHYRELAQECRRLAAN